MAKMDQKELLKDKQVIEEINRHLWIESEKAGYDIGFEKAAADWLKRFSSEWVKFHMPKAATPAKQKTRSAKSFFK